MNESHAVVIGGDRMGSASRSYSARSTLDQPFNCRIRRAPLRTSSEMIVPMTRSG